MPDHRFQSDQPVALRGHHLLCVFGFQGKGYNEAHAMGMAAVLRRLRRPGVRVRIVSGPDAICATCPHRDEPRFASPDLARDQAVLQALSLPVGFEEDAGVLFAGIPGRMTAGNLATLCAGCRWYAWGVCTEGLSAGRIAAGWEEEHDLA
jgi:hypothetical protein